VPDPQLGLVAPVPLVQLKPFLPPPLHWKPSHVRPFSREKSIGFSYFIMTHQTTCRLIHETDKKIEPINLIQDHSCRVAGRPAPPSGAGAGPATMGVSRSDTAYGVKIIRHVPAKAHRASPSPIRARIIGHGATTAGVQARASAVAPHPFGFLRPIIQAMEDRPFVFDPFHGAASPADRQPLTISNQSSS
jgi:hypothetical protein